MHTATYYIDLLLSGITVGSLYALIAIGYTMVYGILRLINFSWFISALQCLWQSLSPSCSL